MDCGADVSQAAKMPISFVFPRLVAIKRRLPSDHPLFSLGNIEREIFAKQSAICTSTGADDDASSPSTLFADDESSDFHFMEALPCPLLHCSRVLSSATEFDDHYAACHRNACSVCGCVLPSPHLLGIHVAERHDSFFAAMAARRKPVFECLVPACSSHRFTTSEARREHLRLVHGYTDTLIHGIVGGGPRRSHRKHATKGKAVQPRGGADVRMAARDMGEGAENMQGLQGPSPGHASVKRARGKGVKVAQERTPAQGGTWGELGQDARIIGNAVQRSQDGLSPCILRPLSTNTPGGDSQRGDHGMLGSSHPMGYDGGGQAVPSAGLTVDSAASIATGMHAPGDEAMAGVGLRESGGAVASSSQGSPANKSTPGGGNRRERRQAAREAGLLKQAGEGTMGVYTPVVAGERTVGAPVPSIASDGSSMMGTETVSSVAAGMQPAVKPNMPQGRAIPAVSRGLMAPRAVCLSQSKAGGVGVGRGGATPPVRTGGGDHVASSAALRDDPMGPAGFVARCGNDDDNEMQAARTMHANGTSAGVCSGVTSSAWNARNRVREAAGSAVDIEFSSQGERIEEWGPHEAYLSCHPTKNVSSSTQSCHPPCRNAGRTPGGGGHDAVGSKQQGPRLEELGGLQPTDAMDVDVTALTQSMSRLNAGSAQGNVPTCAFFGGRGRGRGQNKLVGFGLRGGSMPGGNRAPQGKSTT
eukprot:jgi/Mesvir1/19618/Mv09912-RA.1